MAGATTQTRAGEILERCAAYFEGRLWDSEVGARVRSRLARAGIETQVLRLYGVGYAPGNTRELLDHLAGWQYSPEELISSGIASQSDRTHLHVLFHARIMFPIADAEGSLVGFAGLATHLGPSWPLWLTSPAQGPFDPGGLIFGFRQAVPAIARTGRALILRDCVQVLALHQRERVEAVGVIQSPITRAHLSRLAAPLGADEVHLARRDGQLGVVAVPAGADVGADAFAAPTTPAGFTLAESSRRPDRGAPPAEDTAWPDVEEQVPPPTRGVVYLAGAVVGVGIPIGLLVVAAPHNEAATGSTPTLNLVIVGVVAAYCVLALIVAWISARVRARSRTRRMREPWARGSGEWQPAGWTYHRLEEILVGAALASAITCVVLLLTIGGFLG